MSVFVDAPINTPTKNKMTAAIRLANMGLAFSTVGVWKSWPQSQRIADSGLRRPQRGHFVILSLGDPTFEFSGCRRRPAETKG